MRSRKDSPSRAGVCGRRSRTGSNWRYTGQLLLLQACRSIDLLDRLASQAATGGLTVTGARATR